MVNTPLWALLSERKSIKTRKGFLGELQYAVQFSKATIRTCPVRLKSSNHRCMHDSAAAGKVDVTVNFICMHNIKLESLWRIRIVQGGA